MTKIRWLCGRALRGQNRAPRGASVVSVPACGPRQDSMVNIFGRMRHFCRFSARQIVNGEESSPQKITPAPSPGREKPLLLFAMPPAPEGSVPSKLLSSGLSMSVIRFEPPARPKREVWRCKCDKCRNHATSAGRHRQVRQRKSVERNVVSLSGWLSEPKRLRLPSAE